MRSGGDQPRSEADLVHLDPRVGPGLRGLLDPSLTSDPSWGK